MQTASGSRELHFFRCRQPYWSCTAAEVAAWARLTFKKEVDPSIPDEHIHLAKACLLVALEEEASHLVGSMHPELQELVQGKRNLRQARLPTPISVLG